MMQDRDGGDETDTPRDLVYRGKRIGEMTRDELQRACRELIVRYLPATTRMVDPGASRWLYDRLREMK